MRGAGDRRELRRHAGARGPRRGAALVVVATGDPRIDDAVAQAARHRPALLNVADRPAPCDFVLAPALRRGDLRTTVSTDDRSPVLARDSHRALEPLFALHDAALVQHVAAPRASGRRDARTAAARHGTGERDARVALAADDGSYAPAGADGME